MSFIFQRYWRIELAPPQDGPETQVRDSFVISSNAPSLQIKFSCERSLTSEPNKSTIAITNLPKKMAARFTAGTLAYVYAGYRQNNGLIFKGVAAQVMTAFDPPDTTLTLMCGDGEPYVAYSKIHLQYRGKKLLAEILSDIAKKMHLTLGGQTFQISGCSVQGVPAKYFVNLSVAGLVRDVLDGLLIPFGMSWSIQSGVLVIQNKDGLLSLRSAVVSPTTGLVGGATVTEFGVSFTSLMNPSIVPASAVQLQGSGDLTDGRYRVVKCTYRGDTHGQDWTVQVDAQPLAAPLAPVAVKQKVEDIPQATTPDGDIDGAGALDAFG